MVVSLIHVMTAQGCCFLCIRSLVSALQWSIKQVLPAIRPNSQHLESGGASVRLIPIKACSLGSLLKTLS